MSNRIKQQKKQSDREEKMLEQIRRGKSTWVEFKARKEKASLPNRVNMLSCAEDETEAKQEMMEDTVKVYRKMLPGLLQNMFPELETMPHADTLARFLEVTVVSGLQVG